MARKKSLARNIMDFCADEARNGRRAFGPQRPKTPETQARYIAESILAHQARGIERTIDDYQVTDPALRKMVERALKQQTI